MPLKNSLFGYAMSMLKSRTEAEDILQEAFLKLWNRQESWQQLDNPEGYCMRVIHNLCIDAYRKNKDSRVVSADLPEVKNDTHPLNELSAKEYRQQLRVAYNNLPQKQQQAYYLREEAGRSYTEIADELEISVEQVKVNIFRARNFIKEAVLKNEKVWKTIT